MAAVRVLSVQSVSSLSGLEAELLDRLIADAPDTVATELAVYLVQTRLTPEEVRNLELTPAEQEDLERPRKIVAPRNHKIAPGGYAYDASVVTASESTIRPLSDQSWIDPATGHRVAPVATDAELTLAPALVATDEHGEFLEPPPAAWLDSHPDP